MDLSTVIGIAGGAVVILIGMLIGAKGDITLYIDVTSIFIVLGGTAMVTVAKQPLSAIVNVFKFGLNSALFDTSESPTEMIALANEIARIVQKEGVLALEGYAIKNPFFKKGISLLVDGHDPDFIRSVLLNEMRMDIEQSNDAETLFKGVADTAPGMGMIGTLVGLIVMLNNMADPSSIGPAMAVALITTLYGALVAQVIMIPLAEKLAVRTKQNIEMMSLIVEGVGGIQKGLGPRVLSELLETYLPKSMREEDAAS